MDAVRALSDLPLHARTGRQRHRSVCSVCLGKRDSGVLPEDAYRAPRVGVGGAP